MWLAMREEHDEWEDLTYGTLGEDLQHLLHLLVLGSDGGGADDEGEREVELHFDGCRVKE